MMGIERTSSSKPVSRNRPRPPPFHANANAIVNANANTNAIVVANTRVSPSFPVSDAVGVSAIKPETRSLHYNLRSKG